MKKIVSRIMLTLMLTSMITLAFNIQPIHTELQTVSDHYPIVHAWNSIFSEEEVVALVNGSRAYDYDLELENIAYEHYAFRAGGSLGANETANWIKEKFESFGLETWLEPFEFTTWDLSSKPSLLTDDDGDQGTTADQIVIPSFQCEHYSWPTPESGVFADLVILPLPEAANIDELSTKTINMTEWNAIDTTGKILLIGREVSWCQGGLSTFVNKIFAQPPAAIVRTWWFDWMSFVPDFFNSAGGRPISGWGPYFWDLEIPVGFVNYEDGLTIRNRENGMNVSAHVSIQSVISSGTHYNVVGKISGYENPEKLVIVSSHYDTVMCSGFCDNGAGTAGVIELANVLAEAVEEGIYKPRYTILFVPFTSEELYLVGSINYVKQHKSEMPNIMAVINLDCIGSDDFYVTETNPVNGFDLDQIILDAAQDLGVPAWLEPAGASDQETFRDPSWANDIYSFYWGLDAEISDAMPVESSALLISYPLLYSEEWSTGTPGWIHTSYDNSTSTETLNWVEAEDLGNHIKIAALTLVRVSPDTGPSTHVHFTIQGEEGTIDGNVTISNVIVTSSTLDFEASGELGSAGWINVTFPMINTTQIKVFIDKVKLTPPPFPVITSNGTHYFIYFEFTMSTHEIIILINKAGDLGGPVDYVPTFFAFDGKVDGYDLALWIGCYKGQAPPDAIILADLGGPVNYIPTFFAYDGEVDGYDLALFIQCYKGLGP